MSKQRWRDRAAGFRILDIISGAMLVGLILVGLAVVRVAFTDNPDMSANSTEIVLAVTAGLIGVLSAAVGASLYPSKDRYLHDHAARSVVMLATGVAIFFVLLVVGILISGARSPEGISDNHTKVLLVMASGLLTILSYAAGHGGASILDRRHDTLEER